MRAANSAGAAATAAHIALGDGPLDARLCAAIVALTRHRGPSSSICPSDAARAVGGDNWRELAPHSRAIAFMLARKGQAEILQRGVVRDPTREWRGPVRIRARSTSEGKP